MGYATTLDGEFELNKPLDDDTKEVLESYFYDGVCMLNRDTLKAILRHRTEQKTGKVTKPHKTRRSTRITAYCDIGIIAHDNKGHGKVSTQDLPPPPLLLHYDSLQERLLDDQVSQYGPDGILFVPEKQDILQDAYKTVEHIPFSLGNISRLQEQKYPHGTSCWSYDEDMDDAGKPVLLCGDSDCKTKSENYVTWIEFITENLLAPRGYTLNGEVQWEGDDVCVDMGRITIDNNKIDVCEMTCEGCKGCRSEFDPEDVD